MKKIFFKSIGFLGVLFFILSNDLFSYELDTVAKKDTIKAIAIRNFYKVKIKYTKLDDYEEDIKKWNPAIRDWNHPPLNQIIYVDYPYDPHLAGSSWAPALGVENEFIEKNKNASLSAFYFSSFGNYSEIANEQVVKSGQNFPATLALEAVVEKVTGFLYWAQSASGSVVGNSASSTSKFSIPGEFGGSLYYNYFLEKQSLGFYSGYDFESLNTFNTNKIVFGAPVENVNNKIHYIIFGLAKDFSPLNLKMNVKISLAKSFSSSTNGAEKTLSGSKYSLFYSYFPKGRFNFNLFYKRHSLTGPTKLTITRVGLGVGIVAF